MKKLLLLGALLSASTAALADPNIVGNGGFESPIVTDSCCITLPGTQNISPWQVLTPNVNVVNGTFGSSAGNLAFEGKQFLDLIGEGSNGSIAQTLTTTAGRTYELTFAYSRNLFGGGTPSATASYSIGSLVGSVTHSTGSTSNLDWQVFKGRFVGTGTETLTFAATAPLGGNAGPLLDGVSVAMVPEPSTWLSMLFGFAILGGGLRSVRRRQALAVAA